LHKKFERLKGLSEKNKRLKQKIRTFLRENFSGRLNSNKSFDGEGAGAKKA